MAYAVYVLYNLAYLAFTALFFLYANTYLNSFLIPDSFRWKDGRMRDDLTAQALAQGTILLVEAAFLAYLLWGLNRWFLSTIARSGNTMGIANWSAVIYSIVTVIIIAVILYASFK